MTDTVIYTPYLGLAFLFTILERSSSCRYPLSLILSMLITVSLGLDLRPMQVGAVQHRPNWTSPLLNNLVTYVMSLKDVILHRDLVFK